MNEARRPPRRRRRSRRSLSDGTETLRRRRANTKTGLRWEERLWSTIHARWGPGEKKKKISERRSRDDAGVYVCGFWSALLQSGIMGQVVNGENGVRRLGACQVGWKDEYGVWTTYWLLYLKSWHCAKRFGLLEFKRTENGQSAKGNGEEVEIVYYLVKRIIYNTKRHPHQNSGRRTSEGKAEKKAAETRGEWRRWRVLLLLPFPSFIQSAVSPDRLIDDTAPN